MLSIQAACMLPSFINGRVAGYLRITPYGKPWMLNECFSFLLEAGARSEMGQDSLEVSRLAVERKHRGRILHDHYSVFDQLISGIIDYSLRTHCRYWFVVVAEPIYRLLLKKGSALRTPGAYRADARWCPDPGRAH